MRFGAATTIPYTAVAAVPVIGMPLIALDEFGSVRDMAIREGADPNEALMAQGVSALAYAYLERLQFSTAFGKPLTAGLTEVLLNRATARDVVVAVDTSVDLICAGAARINGQARWDLLACKEQLSSLATEYDLVLMDSAALRHDSAVSRLLMLADCKACVFDATSSARDDLESVRERLRGSGNAIHCILNKVLCEADHLFWCGLPQARGQEPQGMLPDGNAASEERDKRSVASANDSRREFARHPTTFPVVCRSNGHATDLKQELCNISHGGLCFVGSERHEPGTILTIEFPLLDAAPALKGSVVWARESPGASGTLCAHGVRFVERPEVGLSHLVDNFRKIEEYRVQQKHAGRTLTPREAAEELKHTTLVVPSR
jgi:hypothetical protein